MASTEIELPQVSGTPTGAASGDLFGTYPSPSVKSAHTTGNVLSADFTQRLLYSPLNSTVDWGQCVLKKSSNGNRSIDWNAQVLQTDILGPIASSLDWGQRTLLDNNGTSQCVNWGSRLLCYSDSSTALNWQTGNWSYPGGNTAFSLASGVLFDFAGNGTVSFTNYYLSDAVSFSSLDWNQRQAFDFNGNVSWDYGYRNAQNDVGSITIDYQNCQLLSNNIAIVDWINNIYRDTSGNPQLEVGTTGLTITNAVSSFGGVSTAGTGVSVVRRYDQKISQSASITDTTLYTTPNVPGFYMVKVYVFCATGGSAATVSTQIKWTDDSTVAQTVNPLLVTNIVLGTAGTFASNSYVIQVKAATNIKYNTTVSGTIGTGRYTYWIVLTQDF